MIYRLQIPLLIHIQKYLEHRCENICYYFFAEELVLLHFKAINPKNEFYLK